MSWCIPPQTTYITLTQSRTVCIFSVTRITVKPLRATPTVSTFLYIYTTHTLLKVDLVSGSLRILLGITSPRYGYMSYTFPEVVCTPWMGRSPRSVVLFLGIYISHTLFEVSFPSWEGCRILGVTSFRGSHIIYTVHKINL